MSIEDIQEFIKVNLAISLAERSNEIVREKLSLGKHIVSIYPKSDDEVTLNETHEKSIDEFLDHPFELEFKHLPEHHTAYFAPLLKMYSKMNDLDRSKIIETAKQYRTNTKNYLKVLDDQGDYVLKKGSEQMKIFMNIDKDIRKKINDLQKSHNLAPLSPDHEIEFFPKDVVLVTIGASGYADYYPYISVENKRCLRGGKLEKPMIERRNQIREPTDLEYLLAALKYNRSE